MRAVHGGQPVAGAALGGRRGSAPGLRQLDELLDHTRAAGLAVRVRGRPGTLPAPVDTAAYRILQDALTNVIRHATRANAVDVRFARRAGSLEVVVRDDGMDAARPRPGHGLRGMQQRAEALGGHVEAGPLAKGFQVRAVLPLRDA